MASLNRCSFIGNLGSDPEARSLPSGGEVVNVRIAVTEKWKSRDGEQKERTEWVPIVIFNEGLCRVAKQYLRKGSKVYIEGKWQTRKWQAQDGSDRYATECVLQNFDGNLVLLDGASGGQRQQGSQNNRGGAQRDDDDGYDLNDDVPF